MKNTTKKDLKEMQKKINRYFWFLLKTPKSNKDDYSNWLRKLKGLLRDCSGDL